MNRCFLILFSFFLAIQINLINTSDDSLKKRSLCFIEPVSIAAIDKLKALGLPDIEPMGPTESVELDDEIVNKVCKKLKRNQVSKDYYYNVIKNKKPEEKEALLARRRELYKKRPKTQSLISKQKRDYKTQVLTPAQKRRKADLEKLRRSRWTPAQKAIEMLAQAARKKLRKIKKAANKNAL